MGDKEQQQGSIRRLVGRIAPGLEAFSRYEMSWLPTDIGAGLSVAAVARPGIMLAINARPADAVLGRVPGMKGFHDRDRYPEVETIPGLLLYRFEANVVFFNAAYFKERVLAAITQ